MLISETFQSKYLKAADLKGRTVRVRISSISSETMDGKIKPLLFFERAAKGLVLNRTNSATLAYALGDNTDNWIGQDINLFSQMVSFQGQMQPAIRVSVPEARPAQNGQQFAQTPPAQPDRIIPNAANRTQPEAFNERNPPPVGGAPAPTAGGAPFDDEIPFLPEMR